ncbi:M-phase inducer phosphatase 3-like [Paramacrobiotus metropolitanus]|uniref:M-phase inducer phosphatase 3-like n=1 Tax=Paramacrobiotus metropolitanus TaxID=2943436 RepID=UPI00244608B5|nr:M-phase inducer phosphatase 3-like [Paramacrobiotus metropolitanus]XP_055331979.1 M-phase inducer phosphatase 3-like [Paramacrobiotus metropolitanus]XP_055331980.1 M-phase inducer phosphatase 3-like [Paramacrobiotus metropolitanus]XP_055331981.1 M-phase inducer phosphatase 3-like [Paramacrobiotus metropolitanus]XP_055331982.1 M-phase inducer phosphatase 3-like [Paramacrobiotus metropolitanus]XP_055331983.1 M-phase inducer phosphatase 3-like [Paramacrobiotus metropolitanus]XP_055331985.1 M-
MVVTKEQLISIAKKPLKVLNQLSFPVTKASLGPAGHKPLTIGGASRHKRDAGGHCVSEAFLSLKFDDSALEGIEPPRKRQHLASVGNADENVALSPVVFSVGPPAKTNIIGDHSRPHLLPTVSSRHCGLKCITADALKRMILNKFAPDDIERFWIVDCRYPYEYAAGHIRTAVNAYHREDLVKQFFQQPYVRQNPLKRIIVVFHCEFSAERGPLLARYMRNEDRKLHQYPYLAYPEIYLLEGGYKKFFECAKDLCEPPFYTPMRAVQHQSEFIHFKTKAKSFHDFTVMSSRSTRSGNMFDIQSKQ